MTLQNDSGDEPKLAKNETIKEASKLLRGTIAEGLTVTAAEALVAIAVHVGNGLDLAERFVRHHPCARMRVTALDALVSALPGEAPMLLSRATGDPDRFVAGHARARLAP